MNAPGRLRRLVRPKRTASVKKYVVARGRDGLGERLNAILNAMRLADIMGVQFRFSWPSHLTRDTTHAIGPAEDLFSSGFLDSYLEADSRSEGFASISGRNNDMASLRAQLATLNGFVASNMPLTTRIDAVAVPAVARGFSSEFARLGWAPQTQAAIDAARAVELGEAPVGIHLRAGDIIYGKYATWTRFTEKVMSAPVARALIERYAAEGREVVVFGQDDDLINKLCATTPARSATSLRPAGEWSRSALAMLDLVLLARCGLIISGTSGFAIQAAAISDNAVTDFRTLLTPAQIVQLSVDDLHTYGDRYSSPQRSFAFWMAYFLARRDLPDDLAVGLLHGAMEADETGSHHHLPLHLAALHFRRGRPDDGERVLLEAMSRDAEEGSFFQVVEHFSLLTRVGFDFSELFPDFDLAVDSGLPVAALHRAAVRARSGDAPAADEDLARFIEGCREDPRLSGLEQTARSTIDRIAESASTSRS